MKFKIIRRYVIVIALILFFLPGVLFSQESGSQSEKSFLWRVQSSTATVFLLGSIHFMKKDMYPLNSTIENAFHESDALVVEINPSTIDRGKMQDEIMSKGMYQGDETIQDDLSEEAYAMLEAHLKKNNIPMDAFMKYKPGMIVMTLSSIQLMKLGFSPEYGIDLYFIEKAHGKKPILELETMEEQLDLLLDNSMNNDLVIKNSIMEWEKTEEFIKTTASLWSHGNADQMAEMIFKKPLREHPELLPVYQRMFFDRNIKMTRKVEQFLTTEQTYFVVVGAGHLVGQKGIVHLLKTAGYSVDQL